MMCPSCQIDYNPEAWRQCPHCGEGFTVVTSGVIKTSTIMISAGVRGEAGVYHSVDDVPEPLRKMLVKSTKGLNSGTIFIADQRGKDEIAKALRNMPDDSVEGVPDLAAPAPDLPHLPGSSRRSKSALLVGATLGVFTAVLGWLAFTHSW